MKNKKYFSIALYAFLTFVCCFLFYTAVENSQKIADTVGFWMGVLSPFAIGFVFGYVINFIMKALERVFVRVPFLKKPKTLRITSLVGAYLIFFVVVALAILLIVPQLVTSITGLVSRFDAATFNRTMDGISQFLHNLVGNNDFLLEQVDKLMPALDKWLEDLLGVLPSLVPTLLNIITDITSGLTNLLVGVVFSVYLLIDKERLCARVKKLTVAFLKKSRADKLIGLAREVNDSVGDFMVGKLMESLLMGVLSFVAFLIAGLEMPVLLSAIIAISNIVPFFGPLVGALICGVILLLIHPSQLLLFVILEIVLIQLDANLIGPKILGKTTGLDALWIVVAILLGGSLFGFWGILLGVPCFAVIYALLRKRVNHCLADQGLTTATQEYLDYTGQEIHLMEDVDTQPKASLWQKTKQLLKKRKKKK